MASPKVRDVLVQKRERLLDFGVSSMSGAELLSVLTGLPEAQTAQLLGGVGDLDANTKAGLQQISQEELQHRWKFTDAKTAVLLAALELGRRIFLPSLSKGAIMDRPENVAAAFPELHIATVEHFGVLLLDIKNRMIAKSITTVGTIDETIAHPRRARVTKTRGRTLVLRRLLQNHQPSTLLPPSQKQPKALPSNTNPSSMPSSFSSSADPHFSISGALKPWKSRQTHQLQQKHR